MHKFISFIKEFRIPKKQELKDALASFSQNQFLVLLLSVVVAIICVVMILGKINSKFTVEVPASGGTITEGIIGTPTLINPVLAISDADKDLTSIVYSGLMRKKSDGSFIPDIAESYTVSKDGTVYTFVIKKNAKFQDGTKLSADDVVFTINKIKDPLIKSPRKLSWDGVEIEKKDDNTVVFTLKQPYISFLDNTTVGILPMHIWKNVNNQEFALSNLNIKAVGSGPFFISSVSKNSEGVPTSYELKRFNDFALGTPHIKKLNIVSYANEKDLLDALISHNIDQASGLSPENSKDIIDAGYSIHTATLPRIFGIFFNSNNNKIFSDQNVINAFNKALDRQAIVDGVLSGYGNATESPVPATIIEDTDAVNPPSIEEAKSILDKSGWVLGSDGIRAKGGKTTITRTKKVGKKTVTEKVVVNNGPVTKLTFSLTTGDTPELKKAAMLIKDQLELIGAQVDIKKVYETGQLNQVIRSRDYEALFFGQNVNHESDLFSFWHSSQRTDPGLNIAMYSNSRADAILESAQKTLDRDDRLIKYENFVKEYNNNIPALLIYAPKYLYATSSKLNNLYLDTLTIPSDRFVSIYTWYADTDHVWKIFTK